MRLFTPEYIKNRIKELSKEKEFYIYLIVVLGFYSFLMVCFGLFGMIMNGFKVELIDSLLLSVFGYLYQIIIILVVDFIAGSEIRKFHINKYEGSIKFLKPFFPIAIDVFILLFVIGRISDGIFFEFKPLDEIIRRTILDIILSCLYSFLIVLWYDSYQEEVIKTQKELEWQSTIEKIQKMSMDINSKEIDSDIKELNTELDRLLSEIEKYIQTE